MAGPQQAGGRLLAQMRRDLSPAARRKMIADVARKGLAEAEAQNQAATGRRPPHQTQVDGRPTENLEAVNPDRGSIAFRWQLATDLFQWIDEQLILHSPVLTGTYAKSHIFFSDDARADPAMPAPGDVFTFLNTQPYARKIEQGQSKQAPGGVYEAVAALAASRYDNVAAVSFGYRSLQSGSIIRNPNAAAMRAQVTADTGLTGRAARRVASVAIKRAHATSQPAIIITMR